MSDASSAGGHQPLRPRARLMLMLGAKNFQRVISNNRQSQQDRYYFLPAAWEMPDLVIDLQRLRSVKLNELTGFEHVATEDDPHAQSIIAQFGRYSGRIGTPDLNVSSVMERLLREQIENN